MIRGGEEHWHWKGGRTTTNGYISVYQPAHPRADSRNYVYEHVLVMEQAIGRHLTQGEVVHHINRCTTDNRIENLMLYPSRGEHLRLGHPEHYRDPKAAPCKCGRETDSQGMCTKHYRKWLYHKKQGHTDVAAQIAAEWSSGPYTKEIANG